MPERVKVIVRCRPLSEKESKHGCKCIISMDPQFHTCSIKSPSDTTNKTFTFDGVYNSVSTTEEIYNDAAFPLVQDVLSGYNSTIFAYGQTGCGKSFTMQGACDDFSQQGIIPRAIEHIFEEIAIADATKYLVLVSHLEIYNDEIRDLLGNGRRNKLDIKEHAEHGVFVQGISLHSVQGPDDCEKLMQKGIRNRITAETQMNYDSSRSHSVFTIYIEIVPFKVSDGNEMQMKFENLRKGKLNLVDLAGSERQAKAGTSGDRLKEATKINLSLSALGNVISALVDGKSKYIPYRDSKLTRLLQDSLGGNTKTLMVACLSPADNSYEESLSTLRYANRAKNIKNKPRINEDPKDALLREYEREIDRLKSILETTNSNQSWVSGDEQIEEAKMKLRNEYEEKLNKMRQNWELEHVSRCRLEMEVENLKNTLGPDGYNIKEQSVELLYYPEDYYSEDVSDTCSKGSSHCDLLQRWRTLRERLVGGERKHDILLKERYCNMKRHFPARTVTISSCRTSDEESMMGSDNDQRQLHSRGSIVLDSRMMHSAFESEHKDLQNEFEKERKNYLEIIGTLCRQMKLFKQITEKIVPNLHKECNYSNLEWVKSNVTWDEDTQSWILPEFVYNKVKLPSIGQKSDNKASKVQKRPSTLTSYQNFTQHSFRSGLDSPKFDDEGGDNLLLKKFQKTEEENIAGNYFKYPRTSDLLNKVKQADIWIYSRDRSSKY